MHSKFEFKKWQIHIHERNKIKVESIFALTNELLEYFNAYSFIFLKTEYALLLSWNMVSIEH
jgi:hypothetical protein